ncbi:MAG: hypothetical protein WDM96_18350 [Lacunisphaera sp.]
MITAALRRLRDPAVPVCTTTMAGQHTALIEAVHRATPIVALPAEVIRWAGPDGAASAGPEVTGLAPAMHRAFAEGKLLSACGFSAAALRASSEKR